MKRFKIGFLAIVALVAMSFTIANQTGAFKKLAVVNTPCPSGSYTDLVVDDGSGGNLVLDQTEECPGDIHPCVFTLTTSATPSCGGNPDVFCCAELEPDAACDEPEQKRIKQIHCYTP